MSKKKPVRITKLRIAKTKKDRIIELAATTTLTANKIAEIVDCKSSHAEHVLADYRSSVAQVKQYRTDRIDILTAIQQSASRKISELIDNINTELIPARERAQMISALASVMDKALNNERLEAGKSTSNIETIVRAIDDRQARKWDNQHRSV